MVCEPGGKEGPLSINGQDEEKRSSRRNSRCKMTEAWRCARGQAAPWEGWSPSGGPCRGHSEGAQRRAAFQAQPHPPPPGVIHAQTKPRRKLLATTKAKNSISEQLEIRMPGELPREASLGEGTQQLPPPPFPAEILESQAEASRAETAAHSGHKALGALIADFLLPGAPWS